MIFPVFDGHNDFLLRLFHQPDRRAELWSGASASGHMDLGRLIASGFAGGLFSIFVPSARTPLVTDHGAAFDAPSYELPLAPDLPQAVANRSVQAMIAHFSWMERASAGRFRRCRTVAEIRSCQAQGVIGAVLHLEGAEAVLPNLENLDGLHAAGVRSIAPVWSRRNVFGQGVPFRFPAGAGNGPGLSDAGRRLVRACNERRILIDLSHLDATGFDDVAKITDAPLVATHSGAHAMAGSSRNLTDRQLAMIAESDGLVGVNFATIHLRRDGRRSPLMGWSALFRHLDHLIARMGEDRVGFGTDMDGATLPAFFPDVTAFPRLQDALRTHGYDSALMRKLCYENWHSVLERTWGG